MSKSDKAHTHSGPWTRRHFLQSTVAGTAIAACPRSVLGLAETPAKAKSVLVDTHAHIVSPDIERYPPHPLDGKMPNWSADRPVSLEAMIADMNDAGIDKAALVHSSTTYGYDCSYLADSVARDPRRFTGVFSVNTQADDASEKIHYWAVQRKLSGMRLFANGDVSRPDSPWMTSPKTFEALEVAQTLGLPVCLSLRLPAVPQLHVLAKRFPKIRFLIDHMAQPPIGEGPPYTGSQFLFDLAQYPNVYLKLTTPTIVDSHSGKGSPETFFPLVISKFGASRIAWGSNYPALKGALKQMVLDAQAALSAASETDREWIFARTAQSLYPSLRDG